MMIIKNRYIPLIVFVLIGFTIDLKAITVEEIIKNGLSSDPVLHEKRLAIDKAQLKKESIKDAAILPKLEVSFGIGPAPKYSVTQETSGGFDENYDFGHLMPLIGTEIKVAQPLYLKKLNLGMTAADKNIEITKSDIKKAEIELSQNLQEIYYKYQYAAQLKRLSEKMKKNLQTATEKADSALSNDDSNISQDDIFQLKSYFFKADDGIYQTELGMNAAKSAIMFSLNVNSLEIDTENVGIRTEKIPAFDSLVSLQKKCNPDLKKLSLGIEAEQALVSLTMREILPDIYLAGNLKIARTLNKSSKTELDQLLDPFNNTDAALGVALRFPLNVWSTKDKYLKEKLELQILYSKQNYAYRALQLQLKNQYDKVMIDRKRITGADTELKTTESWLNSAFMKYELDPSQTDRLLKAYEKYIQANKDYFECILDYNLAVGGLIATVGLTLCEYDDLVNKMK